MLTLRAIELLRCNKHLIHACEPFVLFIWCDHSKWLTGFRALKDPPDAMLAKVDIASILVGTEPARHIFMVVKSKLPSFAAAFKAKVRATIAEPHLFFVFMLAFLPRGSPRLLCFVPELNQSVSVHCW